MSKERTRKQTETPVTFKGRHYLLSLRRLLKDTFLTKNSITLDNKELEKYFFLIPATKGHSKGNYIVNSPNGSSVDTFDETFDAILDDISNFALPRGKENLNEQSSAANLVQDWLKFVVEYNVPHGKKIRGRLVELTYKMVTQNGDDNKIEASRKLGWIVEILQASFLVADDIMDDGKLRRGQPCWHRLDVVGSNNALNDVFLLEHLSFKLLEKYFGESCFYSEMVKLFHNVTFNTVMGQCADTRIGLDPHKFEGYDEFVYNFIVTYKTAYYTFYLPVALGMILAGIPKSKQHLWETAEKISMQLGTLFQIQDDFMDNFGEEWVVGKVGTDIQEGKCTWLFIQAKQRCSAKEWSILLQNYGSTDEKKVKAVKTLYAKLNLKKVYLETLENIRNNIIADIATIEHENLRSVFKRILLIIYDRHY